MEMVAKEDGPSARAEREAGCDKLPGGCRIEELFQILAKTHMLDLLHVFNHGSEGPQRFVDLQKRLGISPNTLSERLKTLVAHGFLTRTAYNQIPPRVDYAPTEKAAALGHVFQGLHAWAEAHDLEPVTPAE